MWKGDRIAAARAPRRWALLLVLACGVLPLACTSSPRRGAGEVETQTRTLTGTVGIRERLALPDDAVAIVRLEDVSRADAAALILAVDTVRAEGRQPPLPFSLTYDGDAVDPRHRYSLRARLETRRHTWHTVSAYPVLTHGAPADSVDLIVRRTSQPSGMVPQRVGRTFVYACGDDGQPLATDTDLAGVQDAFRLTMRTGPGEAALWLPLRFGRPYLVLGQTRAASGARYAGDGVVLWTRGDEALLQVDDETFRGCRHDRRASIWEHAKLSGADFRAVGQEPGWHLEIREGRSLTLVTDYGQREIATPCSEPRVDPATDRTVFEGVTDAHALTVTLQPGPCADTMSGETFSTAVTVELDGVTYRGCGRPLH